MAPETLPEGTDTIIPGASVDGEPGDGFALGHGTAGFQGAGDDFADKAADLKDEAAKTLSDKTAGLREQAGDKARSFALQGKDKATDALDNVVRMVEDAAGTIDDKVGEQYGDYVRRAGETIAGFSSQLRAKDVDELVDDARNVVRQSPTIAIGAAAAVGFLLVRIAKAAATPPAEPASPTDGPAA